MRKYRICATAKTRIKTRYFIRKSQKYDGALPRCAKQLHGKELSFNNINDANGAIALLKEFDEPAAVAVKHTNPCGVGIGKGYL